MFGLASSGLSVDHELSDGTITKYLLGSASRWHVNMVSTGGLSHKHSEDSRS